MRHEQIALPFRTRRPKRGNRNTDLIGRSYEDGYTTVTVIESCLNDEGRVMLRRDPGGSTYSMPGWLVRLIFMEQKRKRAA